MTRTVLRRDSIVCWMKLNSLCCRLLSQKIGKLLNTFMWITQRIRYSHESNGSKVQHCKKISLGSVHVERILDYSCSLPVQLRTSKEQELIFQLEHSLWKKNSDGFAGSQQFYISRIGCSLD